LEELLAPEGYVAGPEILKGKTVLVTGAGDGIGRVAALSYAAHGATVLLLGRTESKLEAVYDEIEQAGGAKPGIITMDLLTAEEAQYEALAEGLAGEFSFGERVLFFCYLPRG